MQPYFEKKSFRIARCSTCGLMAVANVPEDLSPYYSQGYFTGDPTLDGYMNYESDKEVSKNTYQNQFGIIERFLPPHTDKVKLFEVGCATGFFLELAQAHGWQAAGIDISQYAVAAAVAKGLSVVAGTLETYETSERYHVIVMHDLIEHVKDPARVIELTSRLLLPGGVLVFTTPDAGSLWARAWGRRWHAFVPPQHLFYFSERTLGTLLQAAGFDTVYSAHHGKRFALPYIFRLLFSWTGLGFFATVAQKLAHSALSNTAVPINVGDTLFLIAKKR